MFYTNKEKLSFITYSDEEKSKMDRIVEVFRPIMERSESFQVVWIDKLGYVFFMLNGECCMNNNCYESYTVSCAVELVCSITQEILSEIRRAGEYHYTTKCEKQVCEVLAPCLAQLPEYIEIAEDCILMEKAELQYHIDVFEFGNDAWKELIPDISAVKAALRAACPET